MVPAGWREALREAIALYPDLWAFACSEGNSEAVAAYFAGAMYAILRVNRPSEATGEPEAHMRFVMGEIDAARRPS